MLKEIILILTFGLLEKDYTYGIKFAYFDTGQFYEQKEIFRFKVETDE